MTRLRQLMLTGLVIQVFNQAGAEELIGTELRMHGTVVTQTCAIEPGDDNLGVSFKKISVSDLYTNKKSEVVPFTIRLRNCRAGLFKTVTVTFSGDENPALPNHLALSRGSAAAGIGIGLAQRDGSPVELNKATSAMKLSNGNMVLEFSAWVEAEPEAIKDRLLKYGAFTAVANYTLQYN